MYSPEDVSRIVLKVRREIGLDPTVKPKIVDTVFKGESGTLLIITEDRPDKASILGPGGWVLKRVGEELGVKQIGARALIDIKVKIERVKLSILRHLALARTLKGSTKNILMKRVIPMLRNELQYPRRDLYEDEPLDDHETIVGYSGGVDSTSTLLILKKAGLNPVAVTVDPGPRIIPKETKLNIQRLTKEIDVPQIFVEPDKEAFEKIFMDSISGRVHPCGSCNRQIEKAVLIEAGRRNDTLIGFGDLLPTGSHSVRLHQGYIRLNPLAALAYSKTDSLLTAKSVGHPTTNLIYGCPFLRAVHRKNPQFRYVSIQRVLRETRANILEPNQALEYVKSIFGHRPI
ncbi:MAG: hypothetical protein QXL67_01270 [Candidatus Bathyarchaeia archaeon]